MQNIQLNCSIPGASQLNDCLGTCTKASSYTANATGKNPTEYVYKDTFVYYLTLNGFKCQETMNGNIVQRGLYIEALGWRKTGLRHVSPLNWPCYLSKLLRDASLPNQQSTLVSYSYLKTFIIIFVYRYCGYYILKEF